MQSKIALALLAHGTFGLLNQTLSHVAADIAGLAGRQIAVVALLEVNAQLGGDLILHLIQSALGFRHDDAVRVVAVGGCALLALHSLAILLRLVERLEELDDVQAVYSNENIASEVLDEIDAQG